ncbi:MAG: hypothetical protein WCI57_02520 [Candidatus Berkelbacteria bacterium]
MAISLSTGSLYNMGLHRIFSIAKRSGFKELELMMRSFSDNAFADTFDLKYLKELQIEFDLKITSLHTPIDFEANAAEYYSAVKKLAKELKVKHIIFHIPREKDDQKEYKKWFKKVYLKEMNDQKIPFITENMGKKSILNGADEFNKFPGFCFDTAHELRDFGKKTVATILQMKNIKQFHLSNYDGRCHKDILKNKAFFKEIITAHPEANRCIELSPNAFVDDIDENKIIKQLIETRKFLETI